MQDNKPLVSIIVVSYNHAAFIEECLDSVLAQTYTHWELILADDASKDNSQALMTQWLERNQVKAITNFHTQNTGACTTLNQCLDYCTGAYIKTFAADDVMHPHLLADALAVFEAGDERLGGVFANVAYINEHSEQLHKTIIPDGAIVPSGWIRKELEERNFIPAPTVLLKKEVYDTIGRYDPNIITEDYDCWLRASVHFQFQYINKVLSYYRVHSHNISHTMDFSSDEIQLLIKNDIEGSSKLNIEKRIRDRYYAHQLNTKIIEDYAQYPYRNKWLSFCLQKSLPYKAFRIIDKLLYH